MSFLYLITIFVFLVIYVVVFIIMKRFTNKAITNLIFFLLVLPLYFVHLILIYLDVGPHDWNFINALPTGNISPFMFFIVPLFFFLPPKVRKYFGSAISLLSLGMLLAPIISCIRYFVVDYQYHFKFLLDFIPHIALSLWGVYLVQSEQTSLNVKENLIGGALIVGVVITMLIINVIFDTSFFGLSLRGKHNIYNVVLVKNSFLSALIYFTGLGVVLVGGYFYQMGLLKPRRNL